MPRPIRQVQPVHSAAPAAPRRSDRTAENAGRRCWPSMRFSTFSGATAQLLPLMDADKNGKVSKEEFMRFMQAKFDFADKNKGGELDPEELERLQHASSHPA